MRKYTESMPSATDYRHLKFKIALFFSLPVLGVVWVYSIWGLIQLYSPAGRSAPAFPVKQISATVVGSSRADDGDYLDVEFLTGTKRNRVNVALRRQDAGKYYQNKSVNLVRDDTPGARYDYALLDDYVRNHQRDEVVKQISLWSGALFPAALVFWFWKQKRPKSKTSDTYGKPLGDASS